MKKKIIIFLLVAVLLTMPLCLCACNEEDVGKEYGATLINDIRQHMRDDFLAENRTYSVRYPIQVFDEEKGEWIEEWLIETDAPDTREFIVNNEEEYLRIFKETSSIDVNFEKQMLVIHMFAKINARPLILTEIKIEDHELFVKFKDRPVKRGIADTTEPGQGCIAIVMDKYDITSAQFVYE